MRPNDFLRKQSIRVYQRVQKIMDILISLYIYLDWLDCRQELKQGYLIFGLLHSTDHWK